MTQFSRIGLDTSKAVFTLHCSGRSGESRCCGSTCAAPS